MQLGKIIADLRVKAIILLLPFTLISAPITNKEIGFTIDLPLSWRQHIVSPGTHAILRDTTGGHKSVISIEKILIDKNVDPTPSAWVRSQFLAFKLLVEHSVYPFGAILFYDSTSSAQLGALWSPELYAEFYHSDNKPTQAEYVRYAAISDFGYEIIAYGDSLDMATNIVYYADSLISTLVLSSPQNVSLLRSQHSRPFTVGKGGRIWVDVLGKSQRHIEGKGLSRRLYPVLGEGSTQKAPH